MSNLGQAASKFFNGLSLTFDGAFDLLNIVLPIILFGGIFFAGFYLVTRTLAKKDSRLSLWRETVTSWKTSKIDLLKGIASIIALALFFGWLFLGSLGLAK